MTHKITSILMAGTLILTTSCASIVSKSNYPISINSTPSEASITITNKKGVEIYKGATPANLKLKAGNGFFSKARYMVKFEKEGYDAKMVPVEFKLDGWYFGNILIGGLIGLLIVDPATGAMYKLDTEYLNETLAPVSTASTNEELKVYSINDIPDNWKAHLAQLTE
ncbi:peptidase associated/transthyretin-like domain-containing protein [Aestuariibaculum suncheonense]|nr:PEGA domain-containing protein [Aestuariibaculum suncheonense]